MTKLIAKIVKEYQLEADRIIRQMIQVVVQAQKKIDVQGERRRSKKLVQTR